jgi:group I intron endonuclease
MGRGWDFKWRRLLMVIYKVTNKLTGKSYIGQTTIKLKNRWAWHLDKRSHCIALKKALEKYGKENFSLEEIASYSNLEDLNNAEEYYIELYNTLVPNGYNLKFGGVAPRHNEITKHKMSLTRQKLVAEGKMPWLPKKGEHRSPSTEFQKGALAPNKGRKKQIIDGKIRYVKV